MQDVSLSYELIAFIDLFLDIPNTISIRMTFLKIIFRLQSDKNLQQTEQNIYPFTLLI